MAYDVDAPLRPATVNPSSPNSPADPSKPDRRNTRPGGLGHKPDCQCPICTAVRTRESQGRPTRAQEDEERKQRKLKRLREKRRKAKERELEALLNAEEHSASRNGVVQKNKEFEESALTVKELQKIGGSAGKIADVVLEGLSAIRTVVIRDRQTGAIVEVREYPDYITRHRYAELALKLRGELKPEGDQNIGGLIIVRPDSPHTTPGHDQRCNCEQCVERWNEMIRTQGFGTTGSQNKKQLAESAPVSLDEDIHQYTSTSSEDIEDADFQEFDPANPIPD